MAIALATGLFVAGLGLLLVASQFVITAARQLGDSFGFSPTVSGLTIVAFATSAPELAVVISSLIAGDPDIATGSVVGSNIANVLIVVGTAAVISSFRVDDRTRRFDLPVVIGTSVLAWVLMSDRQVSHLDGAILLAALALYLTLTIRSSASDDHAIEAAVVSVGSESPVSRTRTLIVLAVSTVVMAASARLLVVGAEDLASSAGVSQLVIGLTVVSIGTSMPEIATSLIAAVRGAPEIAVGNAIGSNLFNILFVLGIAGATSQVSVADAVATIDVPVMFAACTALGAIAIISGGVRRAHGIFLLVGYVAYLGSLGFHNS